MCEWKPACSCLSWSWKKCIGPDPTRPTKSPTRPTFWSWMSDFARSDLTQYFVCRQMRSHITPYWREIALWLAAIADMHKIFQAVRDIQCNWKLHYALFRESKCFYGSSWTFMTFYWANFASLSMSTLWTESLVDGALRSRRCTNGLSRSFLCSGLVSPDSYLIAV